MRREGDRAKRTSHNAIDCERRERRCHSERVSVDLVQVHEEFFVSFRKNENHSVWDHCLRNTQNRDCVGNWNKREYFENKNYYCSSIKVFSKVSCVESLAKSQFRDRRKSGEKWIYEIGGKESILQTTKCRGSAHVCSRWISYIVERRKSVAERENFQSN